MQVGDKQLHQIETPVLMFPCEFLKNFKKINFINFYERLLLKSKVFDGVSYCKVLGFHYEQNRQHLTKMELGDILFWKFLIFQKLYRSSRRRYSVKVSGLKNSENFTGIHLRWSLFVVKLQFWNSCNVLKTGSDTGVFLWHLRIFWEYLFWWTFVNDCF